MELCFVTSNERKIIEAEAILSFPIVICKLDLPELQSLDFKKIIENKAREAFDILHKPLLVDDAGLCINAWGGFPGPLVKFLIESGGNDLLVQMMSDESDRGAQAVSALGYHDGKTVHTFVGRAKGEIVRAPRGKGWGWEPIFQPDGHALTYAELGLEEKNKISMRRLALEQFKEFIQI